MSGSGRCGSRRARIAICYGVLGAGRDALSADVHFAERLRTHPADRRRLSRLETATTAAATGRTRELAL